METRTESSEPPSKKDNLDTDTVKPTNLVNLITISNEASNSSLEDDFSQLKTKNTERSKRARRRISSDSSDDNSTSQNRPRKPSDSQYSSEECQKSNNGKKDNSVMETTKPRISIDSVYSSEEDRIDLANSIITISSETQCSSHEDDSSQLKTKNTKRSRRARRCVSSDFSDNNSTSQNRSRKPSDSQYSSEDRQKNNSKRSMSNDSRSSEESDNSKSHRRNKKIKKARQPPNDSSGDAISCRRKNKIATKRRPSSDSSSNESTDYSPPQTRNSKRRKMKKFSKRSTSSDSSSSEKCSDNSQSQTTSTNSGNATTWRKQKKYSKRKANSSAEIDSFQIHTGNASLSEESSDNSQSQSRTTTTSEDTSDESQIQMKYKKKRKTARQLSSLSSEEASTSKEKHSNRRLSNLSDDLTDSQIQKRREKTKQPWYDESETSSETDSISEEESNNSEDSSISKEESDSSQMKKPAVSPKKYKNLRIHSDTSDDEKKEKKLPIESPKKINDVHLLKYKYKELMPAVTFGRYKDVHAIIFNGKTDGDLVLPEFSKLLWRAVKNNRIDPDKASLLVRAGVDLNLNESGEHSDSPENSLLHVVAEKAWRDKYDQLALTLMSHGADINKINGDGNSILWSAVKGGSVIVVEELMRRRVEIDDQYHKVLRLAAESHSNSATILPLLVEYNDADMETRDKRAMYALRCLVKADGDLSAMTVLLDYILPLNDIDQDGSTLLHRAVIDSKIEMVKLLLEYGANPRIKRRDGNPALWCAARQPTSAIAGLLIKHGASVHDCNDLGQYPIHAACNFLSLENIRLLLHYGAELNMPDTYHMWTPFSMVNHQNLNDVTKLIIQHLALLTFNNVKLNECDSKRIREFIDFRKYYAQCLSELHRMKSLIIYKDISVNCIFNSDVKKVSHLIRNSELIDEYHKMKKQIQDRVPVYWPVIHKRMKIAWSRRDKLMSIENALRDASNNVLTVDVCEKIALLACYDSLIDDEMKEISSA